MNDKEFIKKLEDVEKHIDNLVREYVNENKYFNKGDFFKNNDDNDYIYRVVKINSGFNFCHQSIPYITYCCEKIKAKTLKIKTKFFNNENIKIFTELTSIEIKEYRKKLYDKKDFYVLINEVGNIKFGISKDVKERIKTLKFASGLNMKILKIVKRKPELESYFKRKFKKYQLNGEWYKDSPEIRKELKQY